MLLITGATGNLGSSVVRQLQKNLNSNQFIVTSSSDLGVSNFKKQGLQSRLANFNEKGTLLKAFEGVSKLLLISTMESNRFEQHKNVIDAAKLAGVTHIVYTSLAIKDIQSSKVKDLMMSHFETEEYLIQSGVTYTILRNTMYAEALSQILGPDLLTNHINLPGGNGRVPYALRSEMGEATANLLIQENYQNVICNITGSQAYSYNDLAKEFIEFTSNQVDYNDISEESFIQDLKNLGFPDFAIYLHSGTIADIKNHQYELIDNTMEELLGRTPANARDFLKMII